MANISNYLEVRLLDWVFKANSMGSQAPTAVYLGLASNNATGSELEAGTLTNEITGYSGNRKQITFGTISQNPQGKAEIKNSAPIEFELMPAVTVKYAFISDSATKGGGNILWWMELTEPKTTNNGDTLRVPAENIIITLD